jgi:hypothetical protein
VAERCGELVAFQPSVLPILIRLATDKELEVRETAQNAIHAYCQSLPRYRQAELFSVLAFAPDRASRLALVRALTSDADEASRTRWLAFLGRDGDLEVRAAAVAALHKAPPADSAKASRAQSRELNT